MICEPNEKEGNFLLDEIMVAGNFGKYDERIKHGGTKTQHAWEKTKHNLRLFTIPKKSSANPSSGCITESGEDLNSGV